MEELPADREEESLARSNYILKLLLIVFLPIAFIFSGVNLFIFDIHSGWSVFGTIISISSFIAIAIISCVVCFKEQRNLYKVKRLVVFIFVWEMVYALAQFAAFVRSEIFAGIVGGIIVVVLLVAVKNGKNYLSNDEPSFQRQTSLYEAFKVTTNEEENEEDNKID